MGGPAHPFECQHLQATLIQSAFSCMMQSLEHIADAAYFYLLDKFFDQLIKKNLKNIP